MEHLALPLGKTFAGGETGQPLAKLKNQPTLLTLQRLNVADKALIDIRPLLLLFGQLGLQLFDGLPLAMKIGKGRTLVARLGFFFAWPRFYSWSVT
ncbi:MULTISPECIES: hypothetical protein [Aeromonas]|uniref:hypothetical protein n=1 Tax=Aeromonas TaxID=642 RepID=UPI001FBA2133|nr:MULTISPECIES: hypothetical protein [Aeromonas]GKR18634.1 hypothetical protein KAM467_16780 [Aeromonas caviae]GKR44418.1 hypothetical protein KAM473_19370 [Aeromonas caviae]GKR51804.1 hypothetical protein KAM475_09510 [Aeromonas caviae]GKR61226.1 hypothetical protein KAM477_18480 [Aeromonas caviae]GKR86769.1 hypothetical protein KAM483_16700 [Aeromonas caviae]